jgi:hypothetical protein
LNLHPSNGHTKIGNNHSNPHNQSAEYRQPNIPSWPSDRLMGKKYIKVLELVLNNGEKGFCAQSAWPKLQVGSNGQKK